MKLTWFGGRTLRVYIGGQIVVVAGAGAAEGVRPGEVLSGADRVVQLGEELPVVDAARWRPKPLPKALDGDVAPTVEIGTLADRDILIAAPGEPPLVLLGGGAVPAFGRWVEGSVLVLFAGAAGLAAYATVLLDVARPKLIAIAADEQTLDSAIDEISEHLDGAGLVSLEIGMAVEV